MQQIIESVVQHKLAPYQDKLAELSDEVEELRRRVHLINRFGLVSEVHESHQLIKVKHGELETPFIKWFAQAAGKVSHYRCPSVNEQVLLLNYGGGNSGSQYIALVGVDSTQFPFPGNNPDQVVTAYGEQCAEVWDMAEGTLTLKAPGGITLDTELVTATKDTTAKGNTHADGEISDHTRTMQEDRNIYNGHDHDHGDPITGTPNQSK